MGTLPAESFRRKNRKRACVWGAFVPCLLNAVLLSLLLSFTLGVLEQLLTLLPKSFTAEIQLAFLVSRLMRQDFKSKLVNNSRCILFTWV